MGRAALSPSATAAAAAASAATAAATALSYSPPRRPSLRPAATAATAATAPASSPPALRRSPLRSRPARRADRRRRRSPPPRATLAPQLAAAPLSEPSSPAPPPRLVLGAAAGFYAPVRASQCVVMTSVTAVSLRRVVARWAEPRAGAPCGEGGAAPPPGTAAAASVDAAAGWGECPSPEALHAELAARWSVRHSLAARASAWRELFSSDAGQLRVADGAWRCTVRPFRQSCFWLESQPPA